MFGTVVSSLQPALASQPLPAPQPTVQGTMAEQGKPISEKISDTMASAQEKVSETMESAKAKASEVRRAAEPQEGEAGAGCWQRQPRLRPRARLPGGRRLQRCWPWGSTVH